MDQAGEYFGPAPPSAGFVVRRLGWLPEVR